MSAPKTIGLTESDDGGWVEHIIGEPDVVEYIRADLAAAQTKAAVRAALMSVAVEINQRPEMTHDEIMTGITVLISRLDAEEPKS